MKHGSELLTTYHSKSYIVDLSISNDSKHLALAEVDFSGINLQSLVTIISIDKVLANNTDSKEYTYSAPAGNFIINIAYCDSNNLVCIYDTHIDIIKDNNLTEFANFNSDNILFADINNKLIELEKKNTGLFSSEFELKIIDVNTLTDKTYTLNKEPKSIYVFGNVIAVNFGSEALFINNSAWLIKKYVSSQEIKDIILSNDLAGIIYKDKIEFLGL